MSAAMSEALPVPPSPPPAAGPRAPRRWLPLEIITRQLRSLPSAPLSNNMVVRPKVARTTMFASSSVGAAAACAVGTSWANRSRAKSIISICT